MRLPLNYLAATAAYFFEQITVHPGAGQRQHQNIVLNTVDQQSIRLDMTFPMADSVSAQGMNF